MEHYHQKHMFLLSIFVSPKNCLAVFSKQPLRERGVRIMFWTSLIRQELGIQPQRCCNAGGDVS